MIESFLPKISDELGLQAHQTAATVKLLAEGGTVPFIARYRKEATGGIDEVAIAVIRDRLAQLKAIEKRRGAIVKSLEERKLLSDALKVSIQNADTLAQLEDVYLRYKPKRRTKATIAREKRLEPLAQKIFEQAAAQTNVRRRIAPTQKINKVAHSKATASPPHLENSACNLLVFTLTL